MCGVIFRRFGHEYCPLHTCCIDGVQTPNFHLSLLFLTSPRLSFLRSFFFPAGCTRAIKSIVYRRLVYVQRKEANSADGLRASRDKKAQTRRDPGNLGHESPVRGGMAHSYVISYSNIKLVHHHRVQCAIHRIPTGSKDYLLPVYTRTTCASGSSNFGSDASLRSCKRRRATFKIY